VPDGALSTPGDPVYIAISLRSLMETFDFGKERLAAPDPNHGMFFIPMGTD
jgi:hypothetical protein